jgi:hypothetical protein
MLTKQWNYERGRQWVQQAPRTVALKRNGKITDEALVHARHYLRLAGDAFYDVGQGQGWQRNIGMNGSSHLPANIRQWYGDSRGHWEGNTLVIDVTNFSAKTDFQGSRENLHLVERFTRTAPQTLEYEVTIEDPTVWTRPWTVKEEFTKQSDEENRLYYEPRCVEGNLGLPGLLHGRRVEELAFAQGRGPDPRTIDNVKGGFLLQDDPLR